VILGSMPTPRRSEARKLGPAAIIVLAATLLVVGFGVSSERQRSLTSRASSWRGLVGAPRTKVPPDQRALVVLKAPSLAQRVAANGGLATQRQEHEWTREATVAQRQLLTELAGLLVGAGGPGGISGVATGASVLPIRVAGWQRDLTGGWATYARTDQLIAGLERAVDPNLDGDAHDAARIALVGVAAPY